MVTLETAENALKQVYLAVLQNQLNSNIDPVLNRIKHSTNNVWGKEILKTISHEEDNYLRIMSELKNVYGNIVVSDKAVRASQNSAGAFVDLLNDEMENMIKETSYHIKSAFYGEDIAPDYLTDIEKKNYQPLKLSGLKYLFDNTQDTLYSVDRNKYNFKPKEFKIKEFNVPEIQQIIDENNEEINFIICSPNTKRIYQEYCEKHRQDVEVKDMGDGFKCILFNKLIPIHTNKQIPDNTLYLINVNDFTLHQLCDWQWITDENSKILRMVHDKPVYKATLVKYCDIICEHPEKQIKIEIGE